MAVSTKAANVYRAGEDDPYIAQMMNEVLAGSGATSGTTTRDYELKKGQYQSTLAEQIRQFNEQMTQRTKELATQESQYKTDLAKQLLTSPYAANQLTLGALSKTLGYPLSPTGAAYDPSANFWASFGQKKTPASAGNLKDTAVTLNQAAETLHKQVGPYTYNLGGTADYDYRQNILGVNKALANLINRLGMA